MLYLPLLIAAVGFITAVLALFALFQVGMQEERNRLQHIVKTQASLIEAVAIYDKSQADAGKQNEAFDATLSQIINAHKKIGHMGKTGEFVIGRLIDGKAAILVHDDETGESSFQAVTYSAAPLLKALNGESGIIIAKDYDNIDVMAAFEPVKELGIGLVVKVDTAELYQPFINAAAVVGFFSLLTLLGGIYVSRKLAEPVLRQEQILSDLYDSQRDLNSAQALAHLGSWRWNMIDNSEEWSDEQFRIFGYELGEVSPSYELFLKHLHPDDKRQIIDAVDLAVKASKPYDINFRIITKSGEVRFISAKGSIIRDELGAPILMVGTVLDITEKKKHEQKLIEEKTRAERFLSVSGTMIVNMDLSGRAIGINDSGCTVIGCNVKEVVGRNWCTSFLPLEEQNKAKECFADVIKNPDGGIRKVEYKIVTRKNGLRLISWRIIATKDINGRPSGVLCSGEDVTDTKEAEKKFQSLSHRNETILNAAGDGIYGIDGNGLTTFINPIAASMLGYSEEELIGHPLHDIIHHTKEDGNSFPSHECPINKAARDGATQKITKDIFWRKDGTSFPVEYTATPIAGQGSGLSGAVVVFRDVTKQLALQAQVVQTSKLATLGEMATGVAHELNQPLNVIRMATHNIVRKIENDKLDVDYLREKLFRITSQTERASAIINHMRIFGRESSGPKEKLDVAKVVESSIDLVGEQLRLASIDVAVDIPQTPCLILGHAVQLEQVMLNLLANARDALQENRATGDRKIIIKVKTLAEKNKAQIVFSDSAGGIDAKVIDRIFEPFFTTKDVGKGTGLGLSISYGIIGEMDGNISVKNINDGASFTIELPLLNEQQERVPDVEYA